MANLPPSRLHWQDAAALATFPIYEMDNGTDRWAGGFSADGSRIEVIALVEGDEVSVESSRADGDGRDSLRRRRMSAGDMLWRYVLEGDGELALPHSITIEAHDRAVTVGGEVLTVPGMRIQGHARWVGMAQLGDAVVKITTTSGAPLSLRVCADRSTLPESPPRSA